ncbi:Protein DMP5 [Cardamine amara subsp. amara]|uniref:Protein DMP5 n=1 Tax=Cardamine amara subsp. amara TaxID=228776 RepID=A0ABD1AYZ3_CARAN
MSALRLRNANIPASEVNEFSDESLSESRVLKRQMSMSQGTMSNTLTSVANLSNLLPTGTLLAFQLLTPVFTSNGVCDHATRFLTAVLLYLLAASCFVSSFTDSVKADDGTIYFGFVTFKGMWVVDYPDPSWFGLPDLTKYRMRVVDWIHATLSVLVFGAVALRDKYVKDCFCPSPEEETKHVLDIVPVGVGVMCSLLFMVFPTRRHGIGYLVTGNVERR